MKMVEAVIPAVSRGVTRALMGEGGCVYLEIKSKRETATTRGQGVSQQTKLFHSCTHCKVKETNSIQTV